ncbi:MAG: carboxypeptidase-like regulatory domain-containing protein, partial [Bacteroidetes bacterium]|nr:carboxypeptidase-like regulatory domain-containing protein [Bacteroidota bacterium]
MLAGGVWLNYTLPAHAQTPPVPEEQQARYTFVLTGIPLMEALNALIDQTQISLIYETELVEGKTVFCRAYQQLQENVLACILRGTRLDYSRLSSGTYVLFADPRTRPRYGSLAGRVIDADTGAPLADANILLEGEGTGVATNQAGRFAIASLKPGPHLLVVTHVAYHDRADTVWVAPDTSNSATLPMKARTVLTAPIVINGFTSRLPSENLGLGRRTASELEALGGRDVIQDIDAIVGVRVGDALSDVHVQGGASGEHEFLLDGATVFVPIQNGGFIGPFSPFAVRQITVQKAGFEAAHGSHLSGVIEVEHRVAPSKMREVVVQIDPLSFNGRLSGKTVKEGRHQASWMVAGRAGLWGLYQPRRLEEQFQTWSAPDLFLVDALRAPGESPEGTNDSSIDSAAPIELGFVDIHAALHVQRDGLNSIHASFYRGRNLFGSDPTTPLPFGDATPPADEVDDEYAWTNTTSQIRYESVLGSRTFASLGLWASHYEYTHPFDRSPFAAISPDSSQAPSTEDLNEISEVGMRAGWNYAATAKHFLSGNVEAVHTGDNEFVLSLDPLGTTPVVDPEGRRPIRWRLSAFVEDRLALSHRATLTLGSRVTYLPSQHSVYAEPRLAIRYDFPEGEAGAWALRGAVGLYRQFINQFDIATYNATALVPSVRFWLPLGNDGSPPRAYHVTGSILYMPDRAWQFSIESFYKHHPHLLVLDYCGQVAACEGSTTSSSDLLTNADGYGYGLAFSASRTTQTTRLTAQYEYGVARRRVANRFGGAYVTVPWNTPHRFYISLDVAPLRRLTATLRWQGIAGRAWGFRQAYYDYLEPNPDTRLFDPFDLSDPEAHRLPLFSQWDVG